MSSRLKLSNGKTVVKPFKLGKIIFIITFILIIFFSAQVTDFSLFTLIDNFDKFLDVIIKMLPPITDFEALKEYFSFSAEIWPELVITLQMALVGTIIGAIFAFPVAILAASNISSKPVSIITKFVLSLTRTLPVLIYAMILAYIFGLGAPAGAVAITIFTFGIITKMLYEIIERVDMNPFEAAIANGLTKYNAFNLTIKPQIMPSFFSISLYTLEINVRSATIVGYVGAGGIGQQLNDAMALRKYAEVGLIILFTIILVITIDLLTQYIRKEMI